MGSLKAVVLPFIGTLVVLILNCCKFHAGESVHVTNKIEPKSNISSPDTKNEALPTKTEALKEENLREEDGGKDDEILLPTIAPATPHFERMVSSSFILVPTLESTQILSSKPKLESSESGSPGETAAVIKEEDGKYTERARDSSQVDEVVFTNEMFEDTSAKLPEPQKHLAAKVKTDQEQEMSSQEKEGAVKEKVKEVKIARDNEIADDMMKLNKDKMLMKENADSKIEQDSVKDVVTSDKKTDKEKGTEIKGENTENSEDSPKRDDAVTKSDENQESEAKETGILESFKDWKEKQETKTVKKHVQEKPVIRTSTKKQPNQKANYASYECGAKVISSNQEAENTGAILNENRDMYMLNPCSCRIWFVIELCEKIKAETVEIANYELFSSTPEKFNVYFSTRYPTREWEYGGSFNGKAKRNLQSFHIEEKFYAKYIKVEMLSHFGKEHYCPLSLVRVFGRSEVEELEDSEDSHSDSDHGNEDAETNVNNNSDNQSKDANVGKGDEKKKNFLKSATDMVIGLVNKATKSFTGMDEKRNDTTLETNDTQGENAQNIPQNENSSAEVSDTNFSEDSEDKPSASVNVTGVPESSVGEVKLEGGDSVNVTAEQAKNSTSDLVVLIEGDDADEETDPKLISNKCLFNGELLGDRCANPTVRFWIVYLFVRKMCPLNPEQETSGRIYAMNSTKGDSTNVIKKETVVLLPPDDENVDSTVAETHVKHVADKTKFEATTHEESVANGVSSTPHTPVGSTESSIEETGDETTTRPNEGNLSATTKSETTVTQEVKMTTDLAEQATKPMESSCDKVTADHPDLSLLLSAEQSLKQQANTVTAAAENVNENAGKKTEEVTKLDEKNATPLEATVDDKKTTSSAHVDVLVINYDEQLREGKAEVTEKTEVSGNSEIPGKAEKPGGIDNDAVEKDTVEKITSNSTIIIAPSFSQPSSASHSSQKTSDSLLAVGISSNVSSNSSFSNVEQSVSRASVSESVISNDSFMIKATKVPESTAPLSGMTSVNIEVKESFYAVKEKPESDNYDKETNKNRQENIDATVKIGSGSSGNNKESAILKLKSRVKELETNLSLSTLYLEEMSKRYRTALEEQQKQFKSKINTLNLTVIQNKEMIGKQKESIEELTKQVLLLSFHLKNLTDVTKEQYFKISERYVFTCMIEGFIVIILLWTCVRRPRQVPYVEQRRHSAPSAYLNQNGHARSFGPSFANDNDIDDQRPASPTHSLLDNEGTANPVLISVTKRRRQKRKAKQLDDSEFSNAIQSGASNNSETTMVSNTAGVLFSAGKGIFTGLAGAFSKQKRKPIVSRQTRALVDTKFYERIEPAGRSKSLGTIEEHDEVIAPRRNRSFENVRSTKYNKMASRLTNEDKRRG